jgi:hypothetical protein
MQENKVRPGTTDVTMLLKVAETEVEREIARSHAGENRSIA